MTEEEKRPIPGGNGGGIELIASPVRRRYRVEDDQGPIVFQIGDDEPILRIDSDGSIVVRGRRIGTKREIYLGLRALGVVASERTLVTTGPAMLNGVEVPAGRFTLRWELSQDGQFLYKTGIGGKGIHGGPDGRPGHISFHLATGYELVRIKEDGVFVRDGQFGEERLIEALEEWLSDCGLWTENGK